MRKIFQKLVHDGIIDRKIANALYKKLEKDPNFSMELFLKNLGLSPAKIAHYISFHKTQEPLYKFADYKIIDEIARGGMGVVYKAFEIKTERIVALKTLLVDSLKHSTLKKRFYREAETNSSLDHPNIVPVYSMGEDDRTPYISMKYIEGQTLQDFMKSSDFSIEEGIEILRKIAKALHYAHEKKIIHRDIKPSNILLDEKREPYLTDFGVARFTNRCSDLTKTDSQLGTPHYMPPEQIKGSIRNVNSRSDIYSLGVILYQMLMSKLPFQGDTIHALYNNIAHGNPECPNRKKYGALVDICFHAMARKPQKRYKTASAMAKDIYLYQNGKENRITKMSIIPRSKIYKRIYVAIFCLAFLYICFEVLRAFSTKKPSVKDSFMSEDKIFQLAKENFTRKKYKMSLKHLDKIFSKHPKHLEATRLQIQIFEKQGKLQDMCIACMRLFLISNFYKDLDLIFQKTYHHGFYRHAYVYGTKALQVSQKYSALFADCLYRLGYYQKSLEIYQNIPSNSSGMKNRSIYYRNLAYICFYLQNDKKALQTMKVVQTEHSKFISALIKWTRLERKLLEKEWLEGEKPDNLHHKLLEIRKIFPPLALSRASFTNSRKILARKAAFCQKAISMEMGIKMEKNNLETFEEDLKNFHFPRRLNIFFQALLVRYFIYQKKWEKAYEYCNTSLSRFPWAIPFRQLKAFLEAQKGNLEEACEDTTQALKLNHIQLGALKNMISFLSRHITQREYHLILDLLLRQQDIQSHKPFYTQCFFPYFEKLRHASLKKNSFYHMDWKKIIDFAVNSKLENVEKLVVKILPFQDQKLISYLKKLLKDQSLLHTRIRNILSSLEKRRNYQRIEQLLIRYSVFYEKRYAFELLKDNKLVEKIYLDENESPYIRLLAARILIDICDFETLIGLYSSKEKRSIQSEILSSAAFYMANIVRPSPKISIVQFGKLNIFYQILHALCLNPNRQKEFSTFLLQSKNNLVLLNAIYNFRRNEKFLKIFSIDDLNKKLLRLMEHKDPRIQGKAFEIFWNFRALNLWEEKKKDPYIKRIWQNYGYLIPKFLKQNSTSQVALNACITDYSLWKFVQNQVNKKEKAFQNLNATLLHLSRTSKEMKFWATVALSLFDREIKIENIIKDEKTPFYMRANAFFSAMSQKSNKMKFVILVQKILNRKIRSKHDSLFVQIILMTVGYFSHEIRFPLFESHLTRALKSKYPEVQIAAAGSLLWAGNHRSEKKLKSYLKSKNFHMRRAAASSLAGIYVRHRSKKILEWDQKIKKLYPNLCKSAAYGYYILLRSDIRNKLYSTIRRKSFQENYDIYIEALELASKKQRKHWRRQSKKWLKSLKHANLLSPSSFYSYEKGVVHYLRKEYKLALENLNQAYKRSEKESFPPLKKNYHKMRISLMLAKAYFQLRQFDKASTALKTCRCTLSLPSRNFNISRQNSRKFCQIYKKQISFFSCIYEKPKRPRALI